MQVHRREFQLQLQLRSVAMLEMVVVDVVADVVVADVAVVDVGRWRCVGRMWWRTRDIV
jgi:hypothetical protein